MAKDNKLTLSDLTSGLKQNKLSMNPDILRQLEAAQAEPSAHAKEKPLLDKTSELATSMAKLVKVIQQNSSIVVENTKTMAKAKVSKNDLSETDIENAKTQDKMITLLEIIAKNTSGGEDRPSKKEDPQVSLGNLGLALAAALGSLLGIIQGQLKAIKFFAKMLTPEFIQVKLKESFTNFTSKIDETLGKIKGKFDSSLESIGKFFSDGFAKFKEMFNFGEDSKISKVFKSIGTAIKNFIEPFTDALKVIKDLLSGPTMSVVNSVKDSFTFISKYFGTFAKAIGNVAGIVGKLFYPITIIMGIWDTVKGSIEGYKKEGIMGAISGAIKGLVNSVINAPLDLLKDGISWILNKFGFDEASKFLDSFSLEASFTKLIDAIFHPVNMVKSILNKLFTWMSNIQIPAVGVDFGKLGKFSAGPWKPFEGITASSGAGGAEAPPDQAAQVKTAPKSVTAVTPSTAAIIYDKSGKNKEAEIARIQSETAPTVVSAPTIVNNRTNQQAFVKSPIRNTDNSLTSYVKSRYNT